MRARFMRTTAVGILAGVLGLASVLPAFAQEAAGPAATAPMKAPSRADDPQITLPDVPVATVVMDHDDVTGSIVSAKAAPGRADVPMPPPLPFDDQKISPLVAAQPAAAPPALDSAPGQGTATANAVLPATSSDAALAAAEAAERAASGTARAPVPTPAPPTDPVATASTPASPSAPQAAAPAETPPPLDAQTVPQPSNTADTGSRGLDAAALAQALTGFVADMLAGETPSQVGERRKTRAGIAAFYAARADAPLWIADGKLTPAARSVLARLDHAAEDALDLRRFAVALPRDTDTDVLARAELALSEAAVAYARQASGSRVDVAKLGGIIDERPDVATPERVLGTVPGAADAGEALHAFNPPQPGYAALREKLAELRQRSAPAEAQSRIPLGPVLKPGMRDARVPLIRARFGLDVAAGDSSAPPLVYDTKVAAAVADFQRAHGLKASGLLTARTIAALSGGDPSRLEDDIIANMEMWRWMPRDLGTDHIEVNIPDYRVKVVRNGTVEHEARVVVGQPDKQTPVFSQTMKFVIVNPYWNVPLSIIKKEMMPKLASDPQYFANHGYEVVQRDGVTYVRQPPGDGNALGRIKFMFPNSHSVYLHDTNARSFFGRDMRALSHGCVRVDAPFQFAEAVLGRQNGWTEARVKKMIGGKERTINLPEPLPIHIMYFTAFVDPLNGFQLRDDVYGYAGRVKSALGLSG